MGALKVENRLLELLDVVFWVGCNGGVSQMEVVVWAAGVKLVVLWVFWAALDQSIPPDEPIWPELAEVEG